MARATSSGRRGWRMWRRTRRSRRSKGLFIPGKKPHKVTVFPGCTYCQPQVASVGLTERAAKEKGLKFKVGKFPYKASGKAVAAGDTEGFVKVLLGEPARGDHRRAHHRRGGDRAHRRDTLWR